MTNEESDRLKKDLDEAKERIKKLESKPHTLDYKSVGAAMTLAIIPGLIGIMGIGHFYAGRTSKGIQILLLSLFMMFFITSGIILPMMSDTVQYTDNSFNIMVFTVPLIVLYIWQIRDARKTVKQHNKTIDATKL